MNPELKARWVKALRSGEYPQIQGTLRNTKGYCCLGVLADILPETEWKDVPSGGFCAALAGQVISVSEHGIISDDQEDKCVAMNDNDLKSFAEIADYVEEHF